MKILVTGGAGFIGANFVELVATFEEIEEIFVIDNLTYASNLKNLDQARSQKKIIFIQGDIAEFSFSNAGLSDITMVFNFAAESHVDRSISNPSLFVKSNIQGVQNLLTWMIGQPKTRLIQISTDEVYGSIKEGEWDEECKLDPHSPYSASKASADLLVQAHVNTYGIDAIITRCSNNYGKYQHYEKFIPKVIRSIMANQPVPVYGKGLNTREWIHVSDHVRAIWHVARIVDAGKIINIGSGERLTNLEMIEKIVQFMPEKKSKIDFIEDRLGHDFRYSIDSSYLKQTGFKLKTSLEEGLKSTVDWYQNNPTWWD